MWLCVIERWEPKKHVSREIIELMRQRREFGLVKYGRPVQIKNGRDARVDFCAELLDALVYNEQIATQEPEFAAFCYKQQEALIEMMHAMLPDDAIAKMLAAFASPAKPLPSPPYHDNDTIEPSLGDETHVMVDVTANPYGADDRDEYVRKHEFEQALMLDRQRRELTRGRDIGDRNEIEQSAEYLAIGNVRIEIESDADRHAIEADRERRAVSANRFGSD